MTTSKKTVKPKKTADALQKRSTSSDEKTPRRVLLVDDDAEIIESMRTVLQSKGYDVLIALPICS